MRKQDKTIIDPLSALGYEEKDVAYKKVLPWIVALFGFLGGSSVVAFVMYGVLVPKEPEPNVSTFPPAESRRIPPEPIVQGNPIEDMQKFRAAEDKSLNSYSWKDKNAGIVQIPIEDAVKLLAARGEQTPEGGYAVPRANPGTVAPLPPTGVPGESINHRNIAPLSIDAAPPAANSTPSAANSAPPPVR